MMERPLSGFFASGTMVCKLLVVCRRLADDRTEYGPVGYLWRHDRPFLLAQASICKVLLMQETEQWIAALGI